MRINKLTSIPLYVTASILFGIKTYIIYRFLLNISIENILQEIILFLNPFISAFLVFTIAIWFKEKKQLAFIRYITLLGTLLLYFNLIFYRNFTDFLTIPVLFQGSNAADLGTSFLSLLNIADLILVADVLLIWYLSKKHSQTTSVHYLRKRKWMAMSLSVVLVIVHYGLVQVERPQLLQRTFDREYLVKNIGLFNYHIYDIVLQSKTKAQRVFADGNDMPEIRKYINETVKTDEVSPLHGIAKGKNVIFISLESVQSFVINNEVNGEEITPFLNDLIKDSYYFENFYHQTEQGKTSDSEFLIENSLYPLSRGAVYFTHGQNEYNALPEMLNEVGYYTSVFHANNKSFWNRDVMYENIEYDYFYDIDSFEVTEQNSIGWGLKDKEFFSQSIEYLQSQSEPFYSKFITLTNHYPFELSEEDASIGQYDSNSKTLNQYFPTVHYTDEAVEEFFAQMKAAGLYENSIFILMGDHYGISEFHNSAMEQYLGYEINSFEQVQLQRVPFIVHIPGEKGKVFSKIAGQIDVKPTLLSLLGIEYNEDIQFGTDLFVEDRKSFVALRNSDFISEEYVYSKGQCFSRESGELLFTESEMGQNPADNPCQSIKEKVKEDLSYSDQIIYGDLLRFYEEDE